LLQRNRELLALFQSADRPASPPDALRTGALAPVRTPSLNAWLARRFVSPRGRPIPDGRNPVLAAALRKEPLGAVSALLFLALCAVAVPFAGIGAGAETDALGVALLDGLAACEIALLLPGAAATLLIAERERGNLDHLRATPLGAGEVLRGKLLA